VPTTIADKKKDIDCPGLYQSMFCHCSVLIGEVADLAVKQPTRGCMVLDRWEDRGRAKKIEMINPEVEQ
jgi:hypothetical protein